jgi:D-tyrosyl-tRNA(Tyr) deacylase
LYSRFVKLLTEQGIQVQTGVFGASMRVLVDNDGPVTVILEVSPAGDSAANTKTDK